mmetsp:Transcript_8941/g.20293  ORF Transcript_8941/g.20293 Transcript_8941/m.20293 type:complete len:231 (+) Transcript_8941:80-772(+)
MSNTRPSRFQPSPAFSRACSKPFSSAITTKPNPRLMFVSRKRITFAELTGPACSSNSASSCASSTSRGRLATNNLFGRCRSPRSYLLFCLGALYVLPPPETTGFDQSRRIARPSSSSPCIISRAFAAFSWFVMRTHPKPRLSPSGRYFTSASSTSPAAEKWLARPSDVTAHAKPSTIMVRLPKLNASSELRNSASSRPLTSMPLIVSSALSAPSVSAICTTPNPRDFPSE